MKQQAAREFIRQLARFPPHSCGGLIEAGSLAWTSTLVARFPPHSCGGLIEAAKAMCAVVAVTPDFPRIRAGASLKRGCPLAPA